MKNLKRKTKQKNKTRNFLIDQESSAKLLWAVLISRVSLILAKAPGRRRIY